MASDSPSPTGSTTENPEETPQDDSQKTNHEQPTPDENQPIPDISHLIANPMDLEGSTLEVIVNGKVVGVFKHRDETGGKS